MTYGRFLTTHPLFWAALFGIALGVAVATATRSPRNPPDRYRAISRKWSAATLWLTAAIVFATLGVFLSERAPLFTIESAYVAGTAFAVCALALRFPRAAGAPVLLIIAVVSIAGPLLVRPFVPLRETARAATFRVLAADESGYYVELFPELPGEATIPELTVLGSSEVVAVASRLQMSKYLFFLGATGGVRIETVTDRYDASVASPDPYEESPVISRLVARLPFVEVDRVVSPSEGLFLLREYSVQMTAGAVLQIEILPSE